MYGRELGQKKFLDNDNDDVVKTFFQHFVSYMKMFCECFVNIVAVSPSLTNYVRNIVIDSYHND